MTDDEKIAKGRELAAKLFAGAPRVGGAMPETFQAHTMGHLFGDVWQDPDLSLQEHSLVTCTTLVALYRLNEQRVHFVGARNVGIPRAKIEAMIAHVAHYAGWPCAASAYGVLDEVWPKESA